MTDLELLSILKTRFETNMNRHKGIQWVKVQEKLEAQPEIGRAHV